MTELPAKTYTGEPIDTRRIGTNLDYLIAVLYFAAIIFVGTFYGRNQKDTKDFFFGGQRFSWWLISFSLIATTIGSYSFVKYSRVAYIYGIASSQTYLNDWFWVPLFLFGWLPIVFFSRITSVPEYFERRFNQLNRRIVTFLLLIYLVGYVGVNLYTMGTALHALLGIPVFWAAAIVATVSVSYVTFGGQTSVIMTDLLQGVMLIFAGLLVLYLGIDYLGGLDEFWQNLPRTHRTAFANFNEDPSYNSVGIFWQDAIANSAMFYFLNQGILMRFMAARSLKEGRRAAIVVPVVLMPIAAAVVASGGWVGSALSHAGVLPPNMNPDDVFYIASEFLSKPGVFGLILAALTAALMSTVDTLVTAVSAIVVNDVYRPLRPEATEKDMLRMARIAALVVMAIGLSLVPVFMGFDSIYAAHGAFTAAVTPPMVVALLFAVFWRRYTAKAAAWTLVGGSVALVASLIWPELVAPFAHGVPAGDVGDGLFAGAKQYKFMRAFYGVSVSAFIGVVVTFVTKPETPEKMRGLVWGTVLDAIQHYKGSPGTEAEGEWVSTLATRDDTDKVSGERQLPAARISSKLAQALKAAEGDLVFVTDSRMWLGGLRSGHAIVAEVFEGAEPTISLGPSLHDAIITKSRRGRPLRVQKLYGADG
jgi:SSS family solute:Na+ symporter